MSETGQQVVTRLREFRNEHWGEWRPDEHAPLFEKLVREFDAVCDLAILELRQARPVEQRHLPQFSRAEITKLNLFAQAITEISVELATALTGLDRRACQRQLWQMRRWLLRDDS